MAFTKVDRHKSKSLMRISHGPVIGESTINSARLVKLKTHLRESGKVCPKPWQWGRFYANFQPMYESYWLMQWWNTSDEQKHERFMTQLDYLAFNTMRFQNAYWYLMTLDQKSWYYRRD